MKLKSQSALNKILKDRNHETTVQKMVIDSLKEHGYTDPNAKCHLLSFELSILEEIKDQTKVNCVFLYAKTDEETLKWAQNLNAKWQNCKIGFKKINDFKKFSNPPKPLFEKIFYLVIQILIINYLNEEWTKLEIGPGYPARV